MPKHNSIHIGQKIAEVLKFRHMTRQELGRMMGISGSAATYLTTRASIDVETLAAIGNVLKHNFFQHYPIAGGWAPLTDGEADPFIGELKAKISELEKTLEASKRDLMMQKQENGYLKKINELLERK